mmetsp:Transcript_40348/g.46447  ORF Transcript_40348/g.46447 Transcript_40348/m.46447 type:complete len:1244 (-) Transcript_40348:1056-4787(-)
MSSSASGGRKSSRGGRGRGRAGRRGGRGRSNVNRRSSNNNRTPHSSTKDDIDKNFSSSNIIGSTRLPEMKDEDILIAFMPYMKGDNQKAISIHKTYQSKGDQQAFLYAAREFLFNKKSTPTGDSQVDQSLKPIQSISRINNSSVASTCLPEQLTKPPPSHPTTRITTTTCTSIDGIAISATVTNPTTGFSNGQLENKFITNDNITGDQKKSRAQPELPAVQNINSQQQQHQLQQGEASPNMDILERKMAKLISDDYDVSSMPFSSNRDGPVGIGVTTSRSLSSKSPLLHSANPPKHEPTLQQQPYQTRCKQVSNSTNQGISQTTPNTIPQMMQVQNSGASSTDILSSLFNINTASDSNRRPLYQTPQPNNQFQKISETNSSTLDWISSTPPSTHHSSPALPLSPPGLMNPTKSTTQPSSTESCIPVQTPLGTSASSSKEAPIQKTGTEGTPSKPKYQPRRLWTHSEQQPGKVLANNVAASIGMVVSLRPRQELAARWMLPIRYLKEHAQGRDVRSVRDLLKYLSVGLFRRGCTENGFQASIISKEILCPEGESRNNYPFRIIDDAVVGTVPFYSPRTPGHIVFRLYWRNKPVYTLATGPTLNVRILDNDFESSVRFILSNFKGKKVNPCSLSSLNSFSLVLESFQISSKKPASQHQFESAGRAVWGCVCESRKVIDACAIDYQKTTSKFEKLEEEVEELKEKVAEEENIVDKEKLDIDDEATQKSIKSCDTEDISLNVALLREKTKTLMGGRASCERKWRDSQLAFSSILRAIVTNPSITLLLRRELITKLRLEFELWCPLCEEFAVPGESDKQMWYGPLNKFSQPITNEHFRLCNDARSKMQINILGFDPTFTRLENILYPNHGENRNMDSGAVNVFNQLAKSMGQLYQAEYFTADSILKQREMIRAQVEKLVGMCECFPSGTKVAIFGSSANGYGSPKSDLDMCLQVPNDYSIVKKEEDVTGAQAMTTLAQIFEENDMLDVDTSRLSARIPVIKFNCPRGNSDEPPMECDLSMHNPLAVLNTSLLRTYAEINPMSRVMASVIKRWAKARDINNPARHTLSSYGYILMLLHFLTFHQRSGDGLVSPMDKSSRNEAIPLLPNLQWMDSRWPESTGNTPYTEFRETPKQPMQHPREENVKVNSYFYRPNETNIRNLQRLFPGQDLSLAILLASFFRYYAYDFDYKRHVVSLNSAKRYGIVEREVKAELDGWRNYSAALTIEDPFETFYNVAHVLRPFPNRPTMG